MTIPVTTRSGKGSPLTPGEMDANLTQLARDATQAQQGNIRIATQAETNPMTDMTLAVPPGTLAGAITQALANYAASGGSSNTNPGYFRIPNGPMVQFGDVNFGGVGPNPRTINLPAAFPDTLYAVVATMYEPGGDEAQFLVCKGKTTTSFDLKIYGGNTSSGAGWIAIGHF